MIRRCYNKFRNTNTLVLCLEWSNSRFRSAPETGCNVGNSPLKTSCLSSPGVSTVQPAEYSANWLSDLLWEPLQNPVIQLYLTTKLCLYLIVHILLSNSNVQMVLVFNFYACLTNCWFLKCLRLPKSKNTTLLCEDHS